MSSCATSFSSTDLKSIRIALEIRGVQQPFNPDLVKTMQDHDMIHCVDLSKDEEPAYASDIYILDFSEKVLTTSTNQQMENLKRSIETPPRETTKE